MNVLITGGAGYIGSHAVLAFRAAGHDVVVLDDLSTGHRFLVPQDVTLIEADVGDVPTLEACLRERQIGAVIHFAGSIVVPESVSDPLKYYRNNTCASRNLIEACLSCGVGRFIFSSTAAVYGAPERVPADEETPTEPINPYGRSKLMTEWMLEDAAAAHGLGYVALRYFNVAGADPQVRSGQSSPAATHLIKVACEVALGRREAMAIFGDDYDTPDGTCVRDYIHVTDLVQAHVDALVALEAGGSNLVLNCGYGRGYSVREVIHTVEQAAGVDLGARTVPRRAGDPPSLIADNARIRETLDWRPQHDDLDFIVRTALAWEQHLATMAS